MLDGKNINICSYHNKCFPSLVLVASSELLPGPHQHHGLRDHRGEHGQPDHQEQDLEHSKQTHIIPYILRYMYIQR